MNQALPRIALVLLTIAISGFANANADQKQKEQPAPLTACPDLGAPNKLPTTACTPRPETLEYFNNTLHERWVELDSDFEGKRNYVTFPTESNPFMIAQPMRLFLRSDKRADGAAQGGSKAASVATTVETIDLNCAQSEATAVARAYFDAQGKPLGESKVAKPKAERIKLSYRSPLGEVCRRDYIFRLAENGDDFLLAIKRYGQALIGNALPDREIPLRGQTTPAK